MKSRHAAALALVGWYLMVPPHKVRNGQVLVGVDGSAEIAKPMLEVAGGPVPPEPEQSPEEQWHQEETERVDAVINKHFHSEPSKNPQRELDRWYYGSHYLRHVLGVNSQTIVAPGTTLQHGSKEPGSHWSRIRLCNDVVRLDTIAEHAGTLANFRAESPGAIRHRGSQLDSPDAQCAW